ncbi:unnamed protein product [Penicillium olsonii]|nr:unnamed protein product [Penicillium olsonii]CAG7932496.1 unnamed protein product [Penicillium olsonii]
MVSLDNIQASNKALKNYGPNLVGVFVGGTSGIGESTARAFVKYAASPRVYLVGRSETRASQIIEDLRALNPDGQINFIKGDVSRLQEVDEACKEIQAKEEKINLLVLSAGILTMKGRDETDEGLDKKLSLHYYSRMRFLYNLLPQLTNAANAGAAPGQRGLSSVLSVLDARGNAPLILNDLSLKENYSLRNCANHAITMTSLSMEELAASYPATSFVHAYPGLVKTSLVRDNGSLMKLALNAMFFLLTPMNVPLEESGERHLYAGTNPSFAPQVSTGGEDVAIGSDGVQGSGSYLVGSDSATVSNQKVLEGYRADGTRASVWKHTLDIFKGIRG